MEKKLNKLLESVGDMALKRRAKHIILGVNPQAGDNILDVGCGDGYYSYLMSNLSVKSKITGTDFDPNALKSARRNLKGKNIKLFQADLMKELPFRARTFDKAVMSEVCEHLPNDVKGLKEVNRVLKKNGILIVTVPNKNYPMFWDPVNWMLEHLFGTHVSTGFWAGIWNQHERLYSPNEIKKSVEKAGFKVVETKSLTFWSLPFNHNLLYLAARTLYGGGFSPVIEQSVSKYEQPKSRPFFITLAFWFVNLVDKLNDFLQPTNSGVGVFIKAIKS